MTEYDNTNRWVLFRNNRKQDDRSPDYTGTINIDGTEYFLDAWLRDGKSGGKFFSGRVKPKSLPAARQEPARSNAYAQQKGRPMAAEMDDEIPF